MTQTEAANGFTHPHTGLPDAGPLSWAVVAGGQLYTAHIPIRDDGTFDTGSIDKQATLAFENLGRALTAAGGSFRDVVQVQVFLTDIADTTVMNEVWRRFFAPPWPNRATIGIAALAAPGIRIEIVATAVLKSSTEPRDNGQPERK